MSNVFLFFSDVFWKMSDVFMSFFPRFWKWLRFADKRCREKLLFPFSLSKKCLFSVLVCEGCESKKVQIPGTRPRVTCAREKPLFLEQNMTLTMRVSSRRTPPDFYLPFCSILVPQNGWIASNWVKMVDTPIKILWFRPVSLRRNCIIRLVLRCLVCKMGCYCR